MSDKWHGDSRFWMFVPYVLAISTLLALYFDDPAPFVMVVPVIMGGAGAQTTVRHYNQRPTSLGQETPSPEDK